MCVCVFAREFVGSLSPLKETAEFSSAAVIAEAGALCLHACVVLGIGFLHAHTHTRPHTHTHTHTRAPSILSFSPLVAVFVTARHSQDPEMLAEKHGHEMHAELHSAWQNMHNSSGRNAATPTEGSPVHNTVDGTTAA